MISVSPPPVRDSFSPLSPGWAWWFQSVYKFISSMPDSGKKRPTDGLQVGQQFFDVNLGKPIWWSGKQWVDSTGTPT